MMLLWKEIRGNSLLWRLVFVPVALVAEHLRPKAGTLLFVLSVLGAALRDLDLRLEIWSTAQSAARRVSRP
jgi:hypothetical protein